jgi:hypothetical protein
VARGGADGRPGEMTLIDLIRQVDPSFVRYENEMRKYDRARNQLQEIIESLYIPEEKETQHNERKA